MGTINFQIWTGNLPTTASSYYPGLAGVVPLDYASRYEYSIVLQPDDWASMKELIASPAVFLERARLSYSTSPTFEIYKEQTLHWLTRAPLTVVLNPLTIPSTSSFAWLSVLGIHNAHLEAATLSAAEYAAWVMERATTLFPAPVDNCSKNDKVYASSRGVYIAEFAILTRVLNIFYLPPTFPPTSDPYRPRWYERQITPVTVAKVGQTNLSIFHFDVDFEDNWTYVDVAETRATFTMDYIENAAGFLNFLFTNKVNQSANGAQTAAASPYFIHSGPWNRAKQAPSDISDLVILPPTGASGCPEMDSYWLPRVTIDSVWPNMNQPWWADSLMDGTGQGTVPPPSEPPIPPYLCIKVEAYQATPGEEGLYTAGDGFVKYYSEPPAKALPGPVEGNPHDTPLPRG